MPPEPLPPWDRKEFFRERKHERSETLGGSAARWRDSSHHPSRDLNRWGSSDFRRPIGHGKQGGWHFFPEESHHGYSRSGERVMEDENFRPFSRGEGRYNRNNNNRESRGSYNNQREWRGHSWETNSGFSNTPVRAHNVNEEQKSREDAPQYPSHSNGGFGHTWDQIRPREQHNDKASGSNGFGTGQKCDGEDGTGLNDWKPIKCMRSGSLSSRGSGFSHLSSSKSVGAMDLSERKVELETRTASPVQSPSGDANNAFAICASALDEAGSRKKARLGWGEGLAKYEKKKVDGPEVTSSKEGAVSGSGIAESPHPRSSSLADKSPKGSSFSDCASPATPSSVACSSSPGVEDKLFGKAANTDNDMSNLCVSPDPVSQDHSEVGVSFNLEKLDCNSMADFSTVLFELLQSDGQNSKDSSFVRATAMNKVLILKGDIAKNLEVTESEIDQLETELKLLNSTLRRSSPSASSSLPLEDNAKSCNEQGVVANLIPRPAPLQIISSGEVVGEKLPIRSGEQEENFASHKDADVDSPGTVTSKFVEPLSPAKAVSSDTGSHPTESLKDSPVTNKEAQDSGHGSGVGKVSPFAFRDDSVPSESEKAVPGDDMSHDVIFSTNKEVAAESREVFNKLLPRHEYNLNTVSVDNAPPSKYYLSVKERFARRKRFSKFKERVLTLKFKAFQYLWKEDMRLLSIRKHRAKSQKKYEISLRSLHNGYQKHRSSIRSRFSSPAGSVSLVPTSEVINFTSKMMMDSQVKIYRDTLKMPALILDKNEKTALRFISNNGLVEDPCSVEKGRVAINPWTPTEKEIFMEKFAILGKDFKKIATFLEHKTTADCVEFYYKNHKSDCFEKKKKLDITKQEKSFSNSNYLMTSGKKWNRERNAASLDILGGAASMIAASADNNGRSRQSYSRRLILGSFSESRSSWVDDGGTAERSGCFGVAVNDRETAAADVLAGICGSLSSEAMSSCITSSVDPGESYREWKSQRIGSAIRPNVTQNAGNETCSDESCGEMDSTDWTDEEKSVFIQAVSSYGKDFSKISRCVRTRSRDQCKVFFSKARKCLGLDKIRPVPGNKRMSVGDDANGSGSGSENACALEVGSGVCSAKSGSKMDEDLPLSPVKVKQEESDPAEAINSRPALSGSEVKNEGDLLEDRNQKNVGGSEPSTSDACQTRPNNVSDGDSSIVNGVDDHSEITPVNESECVCEAKRPDTGSTIGPEPVDEDLSDGHGKKTKESEDMGNVTTSGQSVSACPVQESNLATDGNSCSGFSLNGEYRHPVSLEPSSKEKSETSLASANSASVNSGPTSSEKNCSEDKMSAAADFQEMSRGGGCHGTVLKDESQVHLSGLPLLTNSESSQVVLRTYPSRIPIQKESNSENRCRSVEIPFTSQSYYHQKCSGLKPQCSVPDFPPKSHSQSLSDSENSSRSVGGGGDVKLFGKILKSDPCPRENEGTQKPSSLKFSDGNSGVIKFDPSSYLGLENVQMRSYAYWDRNILPVSAAFPSIPDSALLLAKYPAAFGNFPTPASKMDQQPPLQTIVKTSERGVNGGVSVFPVREMSGGNGNGIVDYQVFRGGGGGRDGAKVAAPPQFGSRQDMFSEMQRRGGIEALASFQHHPGRGVVVAAAAGVSDPVAALKLHFAKAEQFGGPANGGRDT